MIGIKCMTVYHKRKNLDNQSQQFYHYFVCNTFKLTKILNLNCQNTKKLGRKRAYGISSSSGSNQTEKSSSQHADPFLFFIRIVCRCRISLSASTQTISIRHPYYSFFHEILRCMIVLKSKTLKRIIIEDFRLLLMG